MLNRFIKDESGIALGLAVIMIVLIGVMGAGLLVFVRNDLEAVIEVNQGQKAFDIADSGVQVARQQIAGDKIPAHYDVEEATLCNTDANDPDDGIDSANDIQRSPSTENWAPGAGGQTRTFAGGQFTVTIQWLNQDSSAPTGCVAPETTATPTPGVDYFKVISTGQYRNAKRRVEAIYDTYDLNVPRAYFTPGPITVSGSACVDSVSLFTLNNVTFNGSGTCPNGGTHMQGPDRAYGDWKKPPNTTARPPGGPLLLPMTDAGAGAAGTITGSPRKGTRDFDSTTSPKFVQTPTNPQPTNQITFPFDLGSQPDPQLLCDEAQAQGNYEEYTTTGSQNLNSWPANSSYSTVVCKRFRNISSNNKVTWNVSGTTNLTGDYSGCKGPEQKGTLVIRGGDFSTKSNTALFMGVIVVRGADDSQSTDLGSSTDTGNTCVDGFVNSTGEIKIAGTVRPSSSIEMNSRPGFYGVRTWSWRELYQ
jgi:hypothetical protein